MKTHIRIHSILLTLGWLLLFNSNSFSQAAAEVFSVPYNSTITFTWDAATDWPILSAAGLECYDIAFVAEYREHNSQDGLSFSAADGFPTISSTGSPSAQGCGANRTFTVNQVFDATCFDASTGFSIDVTRVGPQAGTTCGGADLNVTITATITNTLLNFPPDDSNLDGMTLTRNTTFGGGASDCEIQEARVKSWLPDPANGFITDNGASCNPAVGLSFSSFNPPRPYLETCSPGKIPHTIAYTVEDDCGNSKSGSFELRVKDNEPPVITQNVPFVSVPVQAGCLATSGQVMDSLISQGFTGTDNCALKDPIIDLTAVDLTIEPRVPNPGDCYTNAGDATIQLMDECGNMSSTISVNVLLVDLTAPTISGLPPSIDYNSCGNRLISSVEDEIENAGLMVDDMGCSDPADIILEYSDDMFTTNIYDGTNDAVVMGTNFSVSNDCMNATTIYVRAKDACGNLSAVTAIDVNVKDTEDPDVSGLTTLTRGTGSNNCYVDAAGIIAQIKDNNKLSDNCSDDDDLIIMITGSTPVPAVADQYTETCSMGTPWTITYDVTDECGNKVTGATFELTVNDNSDPVITNGLTTYSGQNQFLTPIMSTIYMDADCVLDPADIVSQAIANLYASGLYSVTDNCDMMLDSTITVMTAMMYDNSICGAMQTGSFVLTYLDNCQLNTGVSDGFTSVTIGYNVIDTIKPTLTLAPSVTIDDTPNCPSIFGTHVRDAIIAAGAITSAQDNCTDLDTAYTYDGSLGGMAGTFSTSPAYHVIGGFTLPVTCPATTYPIEVTIYDRCGANSAKESNDVIVDDKSAPMVTLINSNSTDVTMTINSGCDLDSTRVVNRLVNNKIATVTDGCTTPADLTYEIVQSGPFSAECNMNEHIIDFVVSDTCGNAWTEELTLTINQSNPGPSLDILVNPLNPLVNLASAVFMLGDPPFPLDPANTGSSNPDHLYGAPANGDGYWCNSAFFGGTPTAFFNTDAGGLFCGDFRVLELALDPTTCGMTIADI